MAEENKAGAAGDGAQGSGTGAGGAAGSQQGNGQQQAAGQQQTAGQGQGTAGQEAGKTTNDGKAAGDTSQAKPVAFVPKLPDGFKLSDDVVKEFNAIFADEKLSAAGRQQKLIDLQVKQWQAQQRAFEDRLAAQPGLDLDELKADKAFGGPNFQKTIDGALRIERLAFGEELGKLLTPYGMQSNPVIVKGLARLARLIADDSVGSKTGNSPAETDADAQGRAMFPKSWDTMKQHQRK